MNCETRQEQLVHILLGQAPAGERSAFEQHRRQCAACDREALETERLLGLLRDDAAAPATTGFRQSVLERLHREQDQEDRQLSESAGLGDRVLATGAYVRFRVSRSPALRVMLAAAAVHLIALGVYLLWGGLRQPGGTVHVSQDMAHDSTAEPEQGSRVPAAAEERPDRVDLVDLAAFESLAPPRPVDVIEPPADPLPPVEWEDRLDEPLAHAELQLEMDRMLRENLFAQGRYWMRKRFDRRGTDPADRAVRRSLRFLAGEQEEDGSWDPVGFGGQPEARVGVSALCVLAFLSNSERGVPGGLHRQPVVRGLDYLRSSVTADRTIGAVRGDDDVVLFNHSLATLVFVENFVLSNGLDEALLGDALERLEDLAARRSHRQRREADNITAPWVALALNSARVFQVPAVIDLDRAAGDAEAFVAKLVEVDPTTGRALRPGQMLCASACAAALVQPGPPRPDDPLFSEASAYQRYQPPLDLYLQHLEQETLREPSKIFFAALDLHQRGGAEWASWTGRAASVLTASQQEDGSWHKEFVWDPVADMGGDLYESALAILTLSIEGRVAR